MQLFHRSIAALALTATSTFASSFNDEASDGIQVTSVNINVVYGQVGALEFNYKDNGTPHSLRYGHLYNRHNQHNFTDGEYIDDVLIHHMDTKEAGPRVMYLEFHTNKGNRFGAGHVPEGAVHSPLPSSGGPYQVAGFNGTVDGSLLTSIDVIWKEAPKK